MEPATFRLMAQRLSKCTTAPPLAPYFSLFQAILGSQEKLEMFSFCAHRSVTPDEHVARCQWRTEGGGGFKPPLPENPKAFQNRAKLNPRVKTVKNC